METILVIAGLLFIASWAERKFSVHHPANKLPRLPLMGLAPVPPSPVGGGSPATSPLVSGEPSGPGSVVVTPTVTPIPVTVPPIYGSPWEGTSGGLMTVDPGFSGPTHVVLPDLTQTDRNLKQAGIML